MKFDRQTTSQRHARRLGFTLLETSLGVFVTMALGTVLILMLQQHITFMGWMQKQSFLTTEAPQIGNLVGRIFGAADSYFVYPSRTAATSGASPVLEGGTAVRLFCDSVSGDTTELWITVEDDGPSKMLRCYTQVPGKGEQDWTVCKGLGGATFSCASGVLAVNLTGPNGEQISYYGGSR